MQQVDNCPVSARPSDGEGVISGVVFRRRVCASFQQKFADVEMSPGYRKEQGRSPLCVGCIEIGSRTQMVAY